jgi:hypothetical protein
MNRKFYFLISFFVFHFLYLCGQQVEKYNLYKLARENRLEIINRNITPLKDGDREAIRFSSADSDGFAWLSGVNLDNGVIEVDIRGRNNPSRSFVGIAFHGSDGDHCDVIYFRPFNFRSPDPVHLAHCVQYESIPDFPWYRLRQDSTGKYEKNIEKAPDPDGWFHARIVLSFPDIQVFVDDLTEPSLTVKQLNKRGGGKIGLWVGNDSDGDFANLMIRPSAH